MFPAWISHSSGKALAALMDGQSNRWGWHTSVLTSPFCSASTRTYPSWEVGGVNHTSFQRTGLVQHICPRCENTHTTQLCSLAAFLVTCKMFLPVLAYSWFLMVAQHFFRDWVIISIFWLNSKLFFLLNCPVFAIWCNLFFPYKLLLSPITLVCRNSTFQ